MARKMGRNLKRSAAGLMACAAVALCAISPAWAEDRASDVVNVTVPTRIECALGADGTVASPGGLEVVNLGPQDLYVGASTVDDFGQKVEFAMDLGGSPLLSRAGGKDVEGEVEFAGSSRKGLVLSVSKLNRMSHAALMDAAAQGEAPMFTVGFRFTFKALQGSMSISGEAKLGKTLTATVSGAQADAKLAYRWYRDGQLIAGAETASYTTNEADQGKKLKCEAYDAAGRYVGGVSAEVGPIKGPETFAVFSADDGSLNFYKRIDVPKAGEQFEGRTVTEVYTGFDTGVFVQTNTPQNTWVDIETSSPWFNRRDEIISSKVIDSDVSVEQLAYWYTRCTNLTTVDLSKLDASRATTVMGLFAHCHSMTKCLLPKNLYSAIELTDMFYQCKSITKVDLNCIGEAREARTLFGLMNGCTALTSLTIPRQIASDMSYAFCGCNSMDNFAFIEDWDVSPSKGFLLTFANNGKIKHLNLSKWKSTNAETYEGMFAACASLESLDISGLSRLESVENFKMFYYCPKLSRVTLGDGFSWRGANNYLPIQSSDSIPGADGKWYAISDKKGYAPADIPSNKADTYVASPDMLPKETFAVFSEDDGSLNFYHRNIVPAMGSLFEGKTVTEVYTGFIDKTFYARPGHMGGQAYDKDAIVNTPWFNRGSNITSISVIDNGIKPKQMVSWFQGLHNCRQFNLARLDMSCCKNLFRLFMNCTTTESIDMSGWDTSLTENMSGMFYNCSKLKSINLTNLNTKNVKTMQCMFLGCESLTELKLDNKRFITSKVVDMEGMFSGCESLITLDISNIDTSSVVRMNSMFASCSSLTTINLSGLNTLNVADMSRMFSNCQSLVHLGLAGFNTSSVRNMANMFWGCSSLETLDISGFDAKTIENMDNAFNQCCKLRQIQIGKQFEWKGASSYLPSPTSTSISGADGYWYDAATGDAYKPEEIPSNKAAMYVAVNPVKAPTATISGEAAYGSTLTARVNGQPADTTATSYQWQYYDNGDWRNTGLPGGNTATLTLTSDSAGASCEGFKYRCVVTTTAGKKRVPQGISGAVGPVEAAPTGEAFAVYSAYDKSLNFYKRTNVPTNGDWYDGRTVTEVYTDIETTRYYAARKPDWLRHNHSIKNVRFFEPIRPISTSYWFYGLTVANIDLSKLCTSSVTDMSYMFYNCSYAPNLEVSHFNTSNVTNMDRMFYNCSSVSKLDLSNFDTSNVTNMNYMFGGCSSLTTIDMSGFDTSNVSNMDWMYSGCSKLKQVTLGAKFAWKSAYGYLPTPSGGQWYAASDGRGYAPEDIPSNKADTYYASKSLLPVTADEAPKAAMPDVEPCGDAAGTGADPEVVVEAIDSEAVVPGEAENEEAERKPDEDVGAGSDGDEKLDESSSETASAAASHPEEDCLVPVTSDEAQ